MIIILYYFYFIQYNNNFDYCIDTNNFMNNKNDIYLENIYNKLFEPCDICNSNCKNNKNTHKNIECNLKYMDLDSKNIIIKYFIEEFIKKKYKLKLLKYNISKDIERYFLNILPSDIFNDIIIENFITNNYKELVINKYLKNFLKGLYNDIIFNKINKIKLLDNIYIKFNICNDNINNYYLDKKYYITPYEGNDGYGHGGLCYIKMDKINKKGDKIIYTCFKMDGEWWGQYDNLCYITHMNKFINNYKKIDINN